MIKVLARCGIFSILSLFELKIVTFSPCPHMVIPWSVCYLCPNLFSYEDASHSGLEPTSKTSGEGAGNPLQSSCLENPMDGGAWWAAVHGVAKSWTRLSDFTFTFHFHALEKEMATHSSVLAWRIPGTEEPGGLPSMGLHRVGHNRSDSAAAAVAKTSFCVNYLFKGPVSKYRYMLRY